MKKIIRNFIGTFLLVNIVLSGCSEDSTGPGNNPPTANAGADQTVNVGDTVTLNGSASSDPDGDSLVYVWIFVNRPPGSTATLSGAASVSTTFIADIAGTYTVQLTVSDGEKIASASVNITAEAAANPVELNSDINTDTHLLDIFPDSTAVDYILTRTVNVTAKLTIDPGVRIVTRNDTRLDIETGGLIIAEGTADAPIVFFGEIATPGHWNGIYIISNNPDNELTYVRVAHGGGSYYANVYVKYTGQLKLSNCTLTESASYGLEAEEGAKLPVFTSNTFQLNQKAGIYIPASLIGSLDGASSYAGENINDCIDVFHSNVEQVQTWPATDAPYRIESVVDIENEVTIEAGTNFIFADGARIDVEENGIIKALGTATEMITFKGEVETPGYWHGIYIISNNPANELTYVQVSHGGGSYYANVYVRYTGQLKLSNCTLTESASYGLEAEDGAKLPVFTNNTFQLNQKTGIRIPANLIGSLDGASSYAGENISDYIDVFHSNVEQMQTWPATDAPYRIESVVDIENEVTIEAGADFIFADGARIDVEENGIIKAVGTATEMITFKGEVETPGYWNGIYIISNNPANELTFIEVAHGGGSYYANVYVRYTGQLKLTNSNLHDSATYGLYVEKGGQVTLDSNTYSNNPDGDEVIEE